MDIEEEAICVVRVTTGMWSDKKGLHIKKSIIFMRRQCKGYNSLEEGISWVGAEDVIAKILNLDSVDDGIYQVVACNEKRDWETGEVDEWDYRLVSVDKKEDCWCTRQGNEDVECGTERIFTMRKRNDYEMVCIRG